MAVLNVYDGTQWQKVAGSISGVAGGDLTGTYPNPTLAIPGWKKISTATASSSATIDFTGLSSTYSSYMIEFNNVVPATDNVTLYGRVSTDGSTWDSGGDYYSAYNYAGNATTAGLKNDGGTFFQLGLGWSNSNQSGSGVILLHKPQLAPVSNFITFTAQFGYLIAGVLYVNNWFGAYTPLTAIQGFRFLFSSGNIASGTFTLYGLIA